MLRDRDEALIDPKPGDEYTSKTLKVLVLEVREYLNDEPKIISTLAAKHLEYKPQFTRQDSLSQFVKFVGEAPLTAQKEETPNG